MTPRKMNSGTMLLMSNDSSTEVIQVPILEPKRIPTVWASSMRPAFVKPTTIAAVADELWMTAVTTRPTSMPRYLFAVIFSSRVRSLLPAASSRPSPMYFIPRKNSPSPPSTSNTNLKISILNSICAAPIIRSYTG